MPNIKDDSTVEAIAQEFTSNGRCKGKALEAIGYSKGYANTQGIIVVYSNVRVKAAIAKIDAKTAKILDHDRAIAIDLLTSDYANLAIKAGKGDIQAIQARTSIVRELNAISQLHSITSLTPQAAPKPMTDADRDKLIAMAKELTKPEPATIVKLHEAAETA